MQLYRAPLHSLVPGADVIARCSQGQPDWCPSESLSESLGELPLPLLAQVGTDTLRGISRLDQAWIATLADKLEVSLEGYTKPGVGFTKAAKA